MTLRGTLSAVKVMMRYAYGTAFLSIGTSSPDTGRAEGECLYRRQVPTPAFIDQNAVPYAFYRTTTHMFNW